jgi:hypothetical protein
MIVDMFDLEQDHQTVYIIISYAISLYKRSLVKVQVVCLLFEGSSLQHRVRC